MVDGHLPISLGSPGDADILVLSAHPPKKTYYGGVQKIGNPQTHGLQMVSILKWFWMIWGVPPEVLDGADSSRVVMPSGELT